MVNADLKYQPAVDYFFNESKGNIPVKKLAEKFNLCKATLAIKISKRINPEFKIKDYETESL